LAASGGLVIIMNTQPSSPTVRSTEAAQATRTQVTRQRGNFYFGLGFALIAGLVIVVVLGLFGIAGLGLPGMFSVTTSLQMIGTAIALVAIVSFLTLVTLRRTLILLSSHHAALEEQAARHADLAAKVQSQWRAEQVTRDRKQDEGIAALIARPNAPLIARERDVDGNGIRAFRSATVVYDPFEGGQIHPVRDVEGIGDHYGKLLDDLDLKDTKQLWNADTVYVAGALQITPDAVEGWQNMAELMAITGIGKQYAELLVRADVASIDELCAETAQPLLNRIHALEAHQGNRIQGNTIGIKIVRSWIAAAQAHHGILATPKAGA
jgi:hypothetical protein